MFNKKPKKHKYINGVKGAISLFLMVLMLPFVQIAGVLINAQRYNASVALFDEILTSSINSSLAEYDSYLKSRFGLLAFTQEKDADETIRSYLDHNMGVLVNAYDTDYELEVIGTLALSHNRVLRAQIDEYAKYNSPLLFADQFLNLSDLMKSLEKTLNISNLLSTITSGINVCNDVADYTEKIDKLKDLSDEIYDLIDDYDSAHSTLKSDVLALAGEMRTLESLQESLASAEEAAANSTDPEFDNSAQIAALQLQIAICNGKISSLKSDIASDKSEYSGLHTTLISKITQYDTDVKGAYDALGTLSSDLVSTVTGAVATMNDSERKKKEDRLAQIDKELQEISQTAGRDKYLDPYYSQLLNEKTEINTELSAAKIEKSVKTGIDNMANAAVKDYADNENFYDSAVAENLVNSLREQKAKVDAFSVSSVTTETTSFDGYHFKIEGILTSDELSNLYKSYMEMQGEVSTALSAIWEGVKSLVESFLKFDLLYSPELCSLIDTEFYQTEYGLDIEREDAANPLVMLLTSTVNFVGKCSETINDLSTLRVFEFFRDLADLLQAAVQMFNAIVSVIESLISFIGSIFTGDIFTNLWYTYYLVNSLSCRTDYKTGKSITGYSFAGVEFEDHSGGVNGLPIIQDIVSLCSLIFTDRGEDSKIFSGAELEYMLVGSNDEIKNQCITFGMIYLLRLLCNIPIVASPEVTALAVGPQAPVVYALYILLEPFVDTVLLVNSANVSFLKTTPYLSASGIPSAVSALCSALPIDQNQLQSKFAKAINYTGEIAKVATETYVDKLFKFNYKEYIFFVMFIFSNEDNELELYKNIIQMEALAYNEKNRFVGFDIRDTYTAFDCSASITVKEFMPQILSNSLFETTRTQFRGY